MARKNERRRRQRIDVVLPIKIEYNKVKISAETKNISVLGAYLETAKEIPIGTSLDIRIEVPKAAPVKADKKKRVSCKGVAFRCQPTGPQEPKNQYGIGIFFRSFLRSGEKELSKYIDYFLLQEKKIGKIYMRKRKRKTMLKRRGGKK